MSGSKLQDVREGELVSFIRDDVFCLGRACADASPINGDWVVQVGLSDTKSFVIRQSDVLSGRAEFIGSTSFIPDEDVAHWKSNMYDPSIQAMPDKEAMEAWDAWGRVMNLLPGKYRDLKMIARHIDHEFSKGIRCGVCGKVNNPKCVYEC